MDVLPRLDREPFCELDFAIARRDLLHGNHGIAFGGQDRPRHDFETVVAGFEAERRGASRLHAGNVKPASTADPGRARQCDAIHRHAIERRLVALGADVLGERRAAQCRQRSRFDRQRVHAGQDLRERLGRRRLGRRCVGLRHVTASSGPPWRPGRYSFSLPLPLNALISSLQCAATAANSSTAALCFLACMSSIAAFFLA